MGEDGNGTEGPAPTVAWEDRRLAFGGWAGAYDRWRPGYPDLAGRERFALPYLSHCVRAVRLSTG